MLYVLSVNVKPGRRDGIVTEMLQGISNLLHICQLFFLIYKKPIRNIEMRIFLFGSDFYKNPL